MVKNINYIWIMNRMHKMHKLAIEHNLIELQNTGWSAVIHTDDINNVHPDFRHLAVMIDPEMLERLSQHPAARTPAGTKLRVPHLVDLLRYNIIYTEGGAYMDCDEFLLCNPDEYFEVDKLNFLMEHKYMITNSYIYAPAPGNQILKGILDYIDSPEFDYEPWASTGPHAVTQFLMQHFKDNLPSDIWRNQYEYPHTYTIEEKNCYPGVHLIPESVYPIKWTRFHKMLNEGIPFDMLKYKREGYKIVGLFGSQVHKGSYKDGDLVTVFITNTGTHEFIFGEAGTCEY